MNGRPNDTGNRTPSFVLPAGDDRGRRVGVGGIIFMQHFDCLMEQGRP